MTRGEFFLMCVESLSHHAGNVSPAWAARLLQQAAETPEDAVPEKMKLATAALDFVLWHQKHDAEPSKAPAWLRAYREDVADQVTIKVNQGGGMTWWPHAEVAWNDSLAGRGPFLPKECHELLAGHAMEVVVRRATARQFKAWVESVPGHEEEPFAFEWL
jgi:hypothetical protein